MTQRILLMSSSRKGSLGYLEHADDQIYTLLRREPKKLAFVPYAAVVNSFDAFEATVKPVFEKLGYALESIHHSSDPRAAIESADGIVVGGGNTYALLKRMYEADLVYTIREKVIAGTPYLGWSAGSNVATPTIRTTNDMPIVQPRTLRSIGLVPFQINPHFISGKPAGHNGESREERLAEFLKINAPEQVFALPEGSALYTDGKTGTVLGEHPALHFISIDNVRTIREGESFALSDITGPNMANWPTFDA